MAILSNSTDAMEFPDTAARHFHMTHNYSYLIYIFLVKRYLNSTTIKPEFPEKLDCLSENDTLESFCERMLIPVLTYYLRNFPVKHGSRFPVVQ